MSTQTRLDPDARRAAILASARTLFAERPYDTITLQHLADAAGVTRGLVHHYFGGKDAVLAAVIRSFAAPGPGPGPAAAGALDEPLGARVRRRVGTILDLIGANREAWLATLAVGPSMPEGPLREAAEELWRAQYRVWLAAFADVVEDAPTTSALYRSYLGLNQATCRQWLTGALARADAEIILTTALEALLRDAVPALAARHR